MDAALLAEREAFRKRALATPAIEAKKKKVEPKELQHKRPEGNKPTPKPSSSGPKKSSNMGASSQYKFGVLARIVRHMKTRHMDGEDHPLTMEEILDETNQLDVSTKTRTWLMSEALNNNPKIRVTDDGNRYLFKAPFELRDKKSLLKLLKRRDLNGEGAVYMDDIMESLPRAEKVIQTLTGDGKIIQIPRPCDKKKVLFYYDHTTDFDLDDEFIKQWRSISVDGVDDSKIEDYLDKQGIRSMQDQGGKKFAVPKRKKINRKRPLNTKDNNHMKGVLVDYSEDGLTAQKADR